MYIYFSFANWMTEPSGQHFQDLLPFGVRSLKPDSARASFGDCDADKSLRIDCGHRSITSMACVKLGCCYDADASACYYRLNGKKTIYLYCNRAKRWHVYTRPTPPNLAFIKPTILSCVVILLSLLSGWTLCVHSQGQRRRPTHRSKQLGNQRSASLFACSLHFRYCFI